MRHSRTIYGTAEDGWRELDRLHLSHGSDRPVPTVREAYEMWWLPDATERYRDGEMAKSTYANHLNRWKLHVCPRWGDVPVGDVRVLDIQEWLKGKTSSIAEGSLSLLRQVLAFCKLYEVIERNPASGSFRMPKRVDRVVSRDVFTLSEAVRALDALRSSGSVAYIPAVLCGIGSCRVGESLGARVDLGEVRREMVGGTVVAIIDLVRQVDVNGKVVEHLKTSTSKRPIVIPESWSLDVLDAPGQWLCDKGFGEPLSQATARRHFQDDLKAASIEPIPFRNLRNSWRTFMRWELGVPEDMLEAMMGHGGKNVGEVHYDRPQWEAFATVAVDAWNRFRSRESGAVGTF